MVAVRWSAGSMLPGFGSLLLAAGATENYEARMASRPAWRRSPYFHVTYSRGDGGLLLAEIVVISWIVASHNQETLEKHLLPTIPDGGELVVVRDAPSIAVAYAEGQERSTHPVRCYIHHDVEILKDTDLVDQLVTQTQGRGIVGVIGSRTPVMPWWVGSPCGSLLDPRQQIVLGFGEGGPCAVVDGLLLATRQHIDWDSEYTGWHGYDHDACAQMRAQGLENYCLSHGEQLVTHHTTSSFNPEGFDQALERYYSKWGG